MKQGYNLMTKGYNKEHYQDADFIKRMSIIKFLRLVKEEKEYIDYPFEVYGLEEFLYSFDDEAGNKLLTEVLGGGVNYLADNFATIKIITENKVVNWSNSPMLEYRDQEFPLDKVFGSSLRQEDTEYWVANLNIDS